MLHSLHHISGSAKEKINHAEYSDMATEKGKILKKKCKGYNKVDCKIKNLSLVNERSI